MQIKTLALAAVLAFAAAPAFADTLMTATLVQPVKSQRVITSDTRWDCNGASCVSQTAPDGAASPQGCRELTKEIGAVSAYGPSEGPLTSAELAKCNAGRAGATMASSH